MRTDYISRATHFINSIAPYLANATTLSQIIAAVARYNDEQHRAVRVAHGMTRVALVTSDYVVKFNYGNDVNIYGGCEQEEEFYAFASEEGFGEYFCPITRRMSNGRSFWVMPRAFGIGRTDFGHDIPEIALDWIIDHVYDLHEDNVGTMNGHMVVIDYALNTLNDPQRGRYYSSSCSSSSSSSTTW